MQRSRNQRRVGLKLAATLLLSIAPPAALGQSEVFVPETVSGQDIRLLPPNQPPALNVQQSVEEIPLEAAQETEAPGLTLAELEEMALANNPSLAQAQARVQAAQGNWVQVGLKPNPVVGYVANEIGNNDRAGQQGGFVGQEFITAGKLGLNREVASREVGRTEQLWAAQRMRVLNDVRLAYYRGLIAERRLQTVTQLSDIGDELVRRSQALLQAREGSQVNVLQAQTEAALVRLTRQSAENQYQVARRQLSAVVGVPDLDTRPLADDATEPPPPISWEEALEDLRSRSPEIAAAQMNVERARWAVQRERAGRVPDVTGWVAVQHDYSTEDTVTSVQLGVPLPIFNRNQGNIAKARAELRDAERAFERVGLDLMNRLAAVYGRYSNASKQVELYSQSILPDAKRALDLVQMGYRQGETDYLTMLTTQRTYIQTSLGYLDALQEAREATVEIDGLLLTGSLETQ